MNLAAVFGPKHCCAYDSRQANTRFKPSGGERMEELGQLEKIAEMIIDYSLIFGR